MTFNEHLKMSLEVRERQMAPLADDGLLIIAVKILCSPSIVIMGLVFNSMTWILDRMFCLFIFVAQHVPWVRKSKLVCGFDISEDGDAETRWWIAIDLYMVAWTIVLFVFCLAAACHADGWQRTTNEFAGWDGDWSWSRPIIVFAVLLALVRLYEIFAVLAFLHSEVSYQPPRLIRSLINTIWHYCEVTLAFAILYIFVHLFAPDPFFAVDPPMPDASELVESELREFSSNPLNPIYFSFVTITTLGYGDFSPCSDLGKWLVILEVLLGFILLIVVFQRALAQGQKKSRPRPHPGWEKLGS